MKSPKRKATSVKVKRIRMKSSAVVHVEVPRDHVPVVAVHPVTRVVEIVPLPAKKKQSWWQSMCGM